MLVTPRLWLAALAAVILAATASGLLGAARKDPPLAPSHRVEAGTGRPRGMTPPIHWPRLITQALPAGRGAFQAPLMAPTRVPRGNSAQVSISPGAYAVALYACPSAQPPNGPLIGQGSCGALHDVAEAFGATAYSSTAALRQATQYRTPPETPVRIRLARGIAADRWSDPGSSAPIEIAWQQDNWHVVVSGGASLVAAANRLAALLDRETLPARAGILTEDLSGGSVHTSLQWAVGTTVYFASASHTPAHALTLADSMRRYPG
jgi:hypothetical protein